MSAVIEIAIYLSQSILGLFLLAVVIRFLLQITKADFYNPISQAFVKITNPALLPLRKILPSFRSLDLSSLVLALALQATLILLLLSLSGSVISVSGASRIIIWSALGVAGLIVKIYFFALLAMIILSWVAPGSYHPAIQLLNQLVEPAMSPFRKILPPLGGLDFSPILVFILINIFEILIRNLAHEVGLKPWLVMGI